MLQVDHCNLCDHQTINPKTGTVCKLTGLKPSFSTKCEDIDFTTRLKQKIEHAEVEYEYILQGKIPSILYSVVFGTIGLTILIGAYLLADFISEKGFWSTGPLIIGAFGVAVIGTAIGPIKAYKQKMQVAKQKRATLNEVLALYSISYDIEIEFGKKSLGMSDVKVDLRIQDGSMKQRL